jgi:DNA-binding PadR family transcriptional regulator
MNSRQRRIADLKANRDLLLSVFLKSGEMSGLEVVGRCTTLAGMRFLQSGPYDIIRSLEKGGYIKATKPTEGLKPSRFRNWYILTGKGRKAAKAVVAKNGQNREGPLK